MTSIFSLPSYVLFNSLNYVHHAEKANYNSTCTLVRGYCFRFSPFHPRLLSCILRFIYRNEIRHCCFCDPGALRPLFIHRLFRRIHGGRKFTSWTVTFSDVKCKASRFVCIISRIRSPAVHPAILLPLVPAPRGQMHSLKYLLEHATSRNGSAATEYAPPPGRLRLGILPLPEIPEDQRFLTRYRILKAKKRE